jgi:hypothetical protein
MVTVVDPDPSGPADPGHAGGSVPEGAAEAAAADED